MNIILIHVKKIFLPLLIAMVTLIFTFCSEKTSTNTFFSKKHIGDDFDEEPKIANLQAIDLDKNGLLDIIIADMHNNKISWIKQDPAGTFTEISCAENVAAPSHVQSVDFDNDGDLDIIVSLLGMLMPNNDKIGSIIILENDGTMNFVRHNIVQNIYRVSDVRAGDLDSDGDNDLVAVQFGYVDGETRWLENKGNWQFEDHILQSFAGGINCELVDLDKDSDLDIITVLSQQWEQTYLFVNDGQGNFTSKLLHGISNEDFGSSGISMHDLDLDGDLDILYTNGDAFDYQPPRPRPWHGINWLENKGNFKFEFKRIASFGGAYDATPLDIDSDGDIDIFAVSTFNTWESPAAQSIIWLENDGKMNFTKHNIDNNPTHIITLATGDFDNDGTEDLVTGGMHVHPPYDRMARIMLWINSYDR